MKCSRCQQILPANAKYCPRCGQHQQDSSLKNRDLVEKGKIKYSLDKPAQAYTLILVAIVVGLAIVVLILESNLKDTQQKTEISTNTLENSTEIQSQLEKLNQNPESLPLNIEMGNLLFDSGKYDEAIAYYKKALSLNTQNIAVQIDLAVCFFNQKKFDQSITEMNKALEIDPNHPKALFNMGIIYFNIGDTEKAREYWQRLISINSELMESKKAQELLNKL